VSRTTTNVVLAAAAVIAFLVYGAYAGRTSINDGLGPDGPAYAAMVTSHDVQGRSVGDRVWPAFPLATAAVYAVTGSIATSFAAVNVVALIVLVIAACLILDAASSPPAVKVCTIATLSLLGHPTLTAAYNPGEPYLLGVALATLGVATIETGGPLVIAIGQVAAALGSPVGLMAPLYGIARWMRAIRGDFRELLAVAPGLLVWLLIQTWARGGPAGLLDLLRVSRVRSDAVLWTELAFILFGAYFILTSLGGLTIMFWSRPERIRETLRARAELWAMVVPPLVFVATAGLEVPAAIAFLIPFWLVVAGDWNRRHTAPLAAPLLLAAALTILTQRPWTKMNDTAYFVDWFPYSVHAGRVSAVAISDSVLTGIWRVRVLIAGGGVIGFAVMWRRLTAPVR